MIKAKTKKMGMCNNKEPETAWRNKCLYAIELYKDRYFLLYKKLLPSQESLAPTRGMDRSVGIHL